MTDITRRESLGVLAAGAAAAALPALPAPAASVPSAPAATEPAPEARDFPAFRLIGRGRTLAVGRGGRFRADRFLCDQLLADPILLSEPDAAFLLEPLTAPVGPLYGWLGTEGKVTGFVLLVQGGPPEYDEMRLLVGRGDHRLKFPRGISLPLNGYPMGVGFCRVDPPVPATVVPVDAQQSASQWWFTLESPEQP